MIYMPRIDLWAIETLRKEPEYNDSGPETCKLSAVSVVNDVIRIASEAWNLFVEQVDSVTAPASLIIMVRLRYGVSCLLSLNCFSLVVQILEPFKAFVS